MTNLDHLGMFPNQLIDGNTTECVALTVVDICGNIDSQLYDPDFSYAMTLKLMGVQPTTAGLDPYSGMLESIAYGLLPVSFETFTAKVMGELYIANWKNYSLAQRQFSLKWFRKGVKSLYTYESICDWLLTQKTGVSLAIKWFQSFDTPLSDGTLPAPLGTYSFHNVAIYMDDLRGLMIKPWLGSSYGDRGYGFMTKTTFDLVFQSAAAFDENAWRWLSLAKIAVNNLDTIPDILPQLYRS